MDASLAGFADLDPVPADLVVVPEWPDRLSLVRSLRKRAVRLIVERDETDLALARASTAAWGEVVWGSDGPTIRPETLARTLEHSGWESSVQLASRGNLVESTGSQRATTDERRRKRQDDPRNRGC